jgi:hypothetical protein
MTDHTIPGPFVRQLVATQTAIRGAAFFVAAATASLSAFALFSIGTAVPFVPFAVCPAFASVQSREACAKWRSAGISGVEVMTQANGSCRICVSQSDRCDYAAIARAQTARQYPRYRLDRPLEFSDQGDTRTVAFDIRPNPGGSPHTEISKARCIVTYAYSTQ